VEEMVKIRLSLKEIQRLQRDFEGLRAENKQLREEVAYLKLQLKELQDKIYRKKVKKEPAPPSEPPPAKKHGPALGHLGWFRKKPPRMDRTEIVRLKNCPHCGTGGLRICGRPQDHIQEDIVFPQVHVTCYRKHRYYCKQCQKVVTGRGAQELPRSYLGPRAKTLAAYLKYHIKVSDRDIQKLFRHLFRLKLTASAIPGFRNQFRQRLKPIYTALKTRLKQAPFLNADETGWRLDGENHWLWNFSNQKISLTHIDKRRGQKVVEHILGKKYPGILISDFLSAYNQIETLAKQRCLVHLRRDLKRVREGLPEDRTVQRFCQRTQNLIDQAEQLVTRYQAGQISKRAFERKRAGLQQALEDLQWTDPAHKILQRFVKRFHRHRGELLTFLDYPGIPSHNNAAERQIRPHVLLRKITFGNRSQGGIESHNVLMSLFQTAQLNQVEPLQALQKILWISSPAKALRVLIPPRASPT
jgi:transposase